MFWQTMKQENTREVQRMQAYCSVVFFAASIAAVKVAHASQEKNQTQIDIAELENQFKDQCTNTSVIAEFRFLFNSDERRAHKQACDTRKWEKAVIDILDKNYAEDLESDASFRYRTQAGSYFRQDLTLKMQARELIKHGGVITSVSPSDDNGSKPKLDSLDNFTTLGN